MTNKTEWYAMLMENIKHMQDLHRQTADKLVQLEKAFAIRSLFIEAEIDPFKLGAVSTGTRNEFQEWANRLPNPKATFVVIVVRHEDEQRLEFVYPLADVPEVLWSAEYKQAVEWQRRKLARSTAK